MSEGNATSSATTTMSAEPRLVGPVATNSVASAADAPRTTFWFGFWMAVIFIIAKAVHLGTPELSWGSLAEYAGNLIMIAHADVVFTFGVCLVAQGGILLSVRRPKLERVIWGLLVLICLVSVVYAIVSVQIFAYLQSPLTYRLIYLAGDIKNMRSSVGAFVSVPVVAGTVGVPLGYLLLVWQTHRYVQPKRTLAFRTAQGLSVLGLVVLFLGVRHSLGAAWGDRNDRRISENPHWTLAMSFFTEFLGGGTVGLSETFPAEDLQDFQVVGERTGAASVPLNLAQPPRNVIVLILESTATQFLSLYGSKYDTTPRLQHEAANSLVFDNFYCHVGLTANALVAISLGIYPGMTWREYTVEHPHLPGTTVAEVLRPLGYRTAFIHNGDLGYTNQRGFLSGRGFDTIWDHTDLCDKVPNWEFSWGVEDRFLVDGILKWIDQDRTRPFCTLAWTIQAHHPYTLCPPEIEVFQSEDLPGNDGYDLRKYLNIQHEVDSQIGRLLDGLRERGLADDTLVVITGDHGEAFGFPHQTNGHGGLVYQENVNVPLILWNPRLFSPGGRSMAIGGQVDLNPTVLDVLGVPAPDSWQGRSMLDGARPPRAYFYAANDDYLLGVREASWKYIYNATRGRDQLFDLGDDPQEQNNVAGDHPEICQRLRQRLAAWMQYEKNHLKRLHRLAL